VSQTDAPHEAYPIACAPVESAADDSPRPLPARKPAVIVQRGGPHTLIYDPDTDAVHVLNPTAAAIWEGCDGRRTPAELAARLAAAFADTAGRDLMADVEATLAILAARGLLCPSNAAPEVSDGSH